MWDQRYAGEAYVYGQTANTFLQQHITDLTGPVLSVAEGEGRNAVFLAQHGLEVVGVDSSAVGLAKAQRLAKSKKVTITTVQADLAEYQPAVNYFASVVSIFAHLPSQLRRTLHHRLAKALRPGGVLLLEGYSKQQLGRGTGGPNNLDMLFSLDELLQDFPGFKVILGQEIQREVIEGTGHTGLAEVVQLILQKPK
ncbi:class I SAM-dependent methyltransferase [Thiopseudomonas alkaliphila]|uniref:Class I SAM-dependent methyltransferase n=1 Tax=Thiopseudomonas alkaliphila TaxID=1697053 RepID=A0AAW7DQC1_9GAMM|nr:class I SAM-dependent methyltransferase [Thiopseudomonas alkaliphila]MDM1695994.1 class I SAM-dependent methyltransferase [Thiopseudomonas alkaliphila]